MRPPSLERGPGAAAVASPPAVQRLATAPTWALAAWRGEERVLVCVAATERATRLVRHASRLAQRLGSSFFTVHIRTPQLRLTRAQQAQLEEAFEISRDLGGKVIDIDGESAAGEILRLADELRATRILLGQPHCSRLRALIGGSLIADLARSASGLELLIVTDPRQT